MANPSWIFKNSERYAGVVKLEFVPYAPTSAEVKVMTVHVSEADARKLAEELGALFS